MVVGACVVGGVHGGGHAWWGACMARGACVAGGHAWQGGMRGGGHAFHSRYYGIQSMSGRYASYWNAFLFEMCCSINKPDSLK